MKNDERLMRMEIQKRLDDSSWDRRIAGAVLGRKKRGKFRLAYGLSFSTLAAAASIAIIMTAVLNGTRDTLRYESFISDQVRGTYHSVFVTSKSSPNLSPDDDMLSMEGIDSTIDDTLAMR
jgi:hypothetical protein